MSKKEAKQFFINNAIYFMIFLISAIFTLSAVFEIVETNRSIVNILIDSALIMIVGFMITGLFDIQGVFKGSQTNEVIDAKKEHAKAVENVKPYADKLDDYCKVENELELKNERSKILLSEGLTYETCFDENGLAKDVSELLKYSVKPTYDEKLTKEQNKLALRAWREERQRIKDKKNAVKKATKVKIIELYTNNLIGHTKSKSRFDFGGDHADYLKKSNISSLILKVFISLILGYYTIKIISNFNPMMLFWNILQVIVFLAFGTLKFYQAFMFMKTKNADGINKRTNELNKFLSKQIKIFTKDQIEEIAELATDKVINKIEVVEA